MDSFSCFVKIDLYILKLHYVVKKHLRFFSTTYSRNTVESDMLHEVIFIFTLNPLGRFVYSCNTQCCWEALASYNQNIVENYILHKLVFIFLILSHTFTEIMTRTFILTCNSSNFLRSIFIAFRFFSLPRNLQLLFSHSGWFLWVS